MDRILESCWMSKGFSRKGIFVVMLLLTKMYVSLKKLKEKFQKENLNGRRSLEFIVAEDWLLEVTAADVHDTEITLISDLSVARITRKMTRFADGRKGRETVMDLLG